MDRPAGERIAMWAEDNWGYKEYRFVSSFYFV